MVGTNKRYADSIDQRAVERASAQSGQSADPITAFKNWQPPWPPVRIAESEWVILRDSRTEPAGVIKVVALGPRGESFYRVVTWSPTSEGRTLVGYFSTLHEADRSILFAGA